MGNAKGYILAIALPSHIHTSLYLCHEESENNIVERERIYFSCL